MVDFINEERHGHIITIEDPVEFVHPHQGCIVNQREVGVDTNSYEEALKNSKALSFESNEELREVVRQIELEERHPPGPVRLSFHFSSTG